MGRDKSVENQSSESIRGVQVDGWVLDFFLGGRAKQVLGISRYFNIFANQSLPIDLFFSPVV